MAVTRRPRRGPGRLVFGAVLVTVVILLVNAAVHSRPSSRENVLSYVDQVRPLVQRSTNEGADLNDVRANAVQLGRDGIQRRLDRLAGETQATLSQLTGIVPPPSLRVANAYLVAALGVRNKAAQEARTAFAAALAVGPPDPAMQGLVGAGQDMELGDRSFALFSGALPAGTVTPVPISTWVPDPTTWADQEVSVFVTTLRSSTSLTPVHDLAIVTFSTDPAPVGNDNTATVLPPTRGLQVAIVVANVGNVAEHHVTVTATLYTNGANTTEMVRDFMDLAPGQRASTKIGNLHPVSGTTGTLTAAVVAVAGESNLNNNAQTWTVEVR